MTTKSATICPQCGTTTDGKFCGECGANLGGSDCSHCGTSLSTGARFCHVCGTQVGGRTGRVAASTAAIPWIVTAVSVTALVVTLAVMVNSPKQPPQQTQGAAARPAPDISNMTPRQQADRLFDRVMTARERGDSGEVAFFKPMAIGAYQQLGDPDADAIFHLGLIYATTGEPEAALEQASTLEAKNPAHLFASLLRETVALMMGDTAAETAAHSAFLENFDAEMATDKPEYAAHRTMLDEFKLRAETQTR